MFFIISLVLFISDMAERKFTRGLNKPGMAAQLRESVSQVVRESAVLVSEFLLCYWSSFFSTFLLLNMHININSSLNIVKFVSLLIFFLFISFDVTPIELISSSNPAYLYCDDA